jgi:hypothetical protein
MSSRVVFWTVLFLTVVCGGAAGILALACGPQLSASLADYQEQLLRIFIAGAVAIFSLLGSRGRK